VPPWAALLQVQPQVLLAAQWVLWWVAWQVPLLAGWPARRLPRP
jgi:hypothetical protein